MTITNILEQISKIPKEYHDYELVAVSDIGEPLDSFNIKIDIVKYGIYLVKDCNSTPFITCPESAEEAKELDSEGWPKLYNEVRPTVEVDYLPE